LRNAHGETAEPLVLYDVELVRIDRTKRTLTFRHEGCALVICPCDVSRWLAGAVGRLTLRADGEVSFLIYADPRLRRAPDFDQYEAGLWGWRLGEYHFCVRAGVIPGVNGAVIAEDVEPLQLAIPREFLDLCVRFRVTPENALRAFIADVCCLQSAVLRPREDGFSSLGSEEREYARAYWLRAHGLPVE
jgi:hypothetical protein